MSDSSGTRRGMIVDACVLIDFIRVDPALLRLVARLVGPAYVISPVVDELNDIDDVAELEQLGLVVEEPAIEDAFAAARGLGPTSFQDRLCVLSAKRKGLMCVTNDKHLRKLCKEEGVPVLWGLQLLVELYRRGGISAEEALNVARMIHMVNPKHITMRILSDFAATIKKHKRC